MVARATSPTALLARGRPSIAKFVLLVKAGVHHLQSTYVFSGRPTPNAIVITAGVGVLFFITTSDPHMRTFPPSLVISHKWA
jgi:hypothetical protein